jgi:hypothetical protein
VSYTIGITASNLLGSGPTSFTTAEILPSANNDGWDGLGKFVASVQPGSAASFVLGPGVWNVSHPIDITNIDMTIRGSAAGGTVLDARKLCWFFEVRQRGILRLHGPLTLVNGAYGKVPSMKGTYNAIGRLKVHITRMESIGAIYAIGRSKVYARGVAFTKCSGSVIRTMDARAEVLDCDFTENMAPFISFYSCTPYSSADDDEDVHVLSITESRFERNAATFARVVRSYMNDGFSCS